MRVSYPEIRKSHGMELCNVCIKPIKALTDKVRHRRPLSEVPVLTDDK